MKVCAVVVLKTGADCTLPLISATARRMRLGLPVLALKEVMLQSLPEVKLPVATFVTATSALAKVGKTPQETTRANIVRTRRAALAMQLRFTVEALRSRPKRTQQKRDSSWLF